MKDREGRTAFFNTAGRYTSFVTVAKDDAIFAVRTDDLDVGRSLFIKQGRGEMSVIRRCVSALKKLLGENAIRDKTFVDVGANIGTSVIYALSAHEFSRGVAIEPEPANFRNLELNKVLNDLDERLLCLNFAVSDAPGSIDFVVGEKSGKHAVLPSGRTANPGKGQAVIQVRAVSLDSLVEQGSLVPNEVGLLWVDAQAHEAHILAGAKVLREHNVPVVLEWDPIHLERADGRKRLESILAESYTHFIDLRRTPDTSDPHHKLRKLSELEKYSERFFDRAEGQGRFTDILVLSPTQGLPSDSN